MSLRPLDTTIAHKAINLTSELSGNDKRVAGAIVDSFNRKTGQCDPSLGRIAGLLGVSRRTVIRAVQRLEKLKLVRKLRHGGHSHRNSYEPNWARFREIDAQWSVRFRTKSTWSGATDVSHCECQSCHDVGDAAVNQTCSINSSQKTHSEAEVSAKLSSGPKDREGQPSKEKRHHGTRFVHSRTAGGSQALVAADTAAERRWNDELLQRYSARPNVYAAIVDAISAELQRAATEAEKHKRGAGLALILEQLQLKSASSAANTDTIEDSSKLEEAPRVCEP